MLEEDQPTPATWMTAVPFQLGQNLYEPGERLEHVYLPTAGMVSLVLVMPDGRSSDTAAIGCEGPLELSASGPIN